MVENLNNLPKMIVRNSDSIIFSWEHVFRNKKGKCMLQMCDDLKNWNTIYWGSKREYLVNNLEACACYNFRIREEYSDKWTNFKGVTDDGPYLVKHLSRAVNMGKTALIRKIVNKRPLLLEVENKQSKTALIQAVEKGDLQLVHLLITLGAKVNNSIQHVKRTPLMIAIFQGKLDIATFLIEKGADTKARDVNDLTILHYAVDSGCLENVKFVTNIGVNVNLKDSSGWTPLFRAVILQKHEDIIKFLVNHGAELDVKDKNGFDFHKHCKLSDINYNININ